MTMRRAMVTNPLLAPQHPPKKVTTYFILLRTVGREYILLPCKIGWCYPGKAVPPNTSHKQHGYSICYGAALACQHYLDSTTYGSDCRTKYTGLKNAVPPRACTKASSEERSPKSSGRVISTRDSLISSRPLGSSTVAVVIAGVTFSSLLSWNR